MASFFLLGNFQKEQLGTVLNNPQSGFDYLCCWSDLEMNLMWGLSKRKSEVGSSEERQTKTNHNSLFRRIFGGGELPFFAEISKPEIFLAKT